MSSIRQCVQQCSNELHGSFSSICLVIIVILRPNHFASWQRQLPTIGNLIPPNQPSAFHPHVPPARLGWSKPGSVGDGTLSFHVGFLTFVSRYLSLWGGYLGLVFRGFRVFRYKGGRGGRVWSGLASRVP
jgi:hypothetical protein